MLIAGTYTPFTLGVLGGPWGWTLFGLVWGAALVGISAKLIAGFNYPRVSLVAYLTMGWLVVIAIRPLWSTMDLAGIVWLVVGGLAYTVGAAFYAAPQTEIRSLCVALVRAWRFHMPFLRGPLVRS